MVALFRAGGTVPTLPFNGLTGLTGLAIPERGTRAAKANQLSMVAPFHEVPLIKHRNLIGVAYLAEAMGNGEHRHRLGHLDEGGKDAGFAQAVEGAAGLIQNQELGLSQKSASQGKALPLPSAELETPFADCDVVLIWQVEDEGFRVGCPML
ncbi:MAG: hypothetical protein NTZ40_13530 [Cyanobacteria bacterium]|nr:hypothetical protein [Cyanobacteriota bacterium]